MEELYLYIAERLANEVPGLVTIDEDTGQLIETGDQYPVLFPCALINVADIQWESDKYASEQRGDVTVTVKNAFSCYEDTHLSSQPSRDGFVRLKERNRMHKKICKALHRYNFDQDTMSELRRLSTRCYTLFGNVKVYESTFALKITEDLFDD